MEAVAPITFERKPYVIEYYKDGEKKKLRRIPPQKMHIALPKDKVVLTSSKNADYREGEEFEVAHISTRQPNVLQLEDEDGHKTFVSYRDIKVIKKGPNHTDGSDETNPITPYGGRYLVWP